MSDFNITVNAGQPLRLLTAGKYCDRNITIETIGGDPMTAPLIVRAPSGSTVTVSKDGVTKEAPEVDGVWTFTGLSPGIWTVTASKDANEATGEISIDFQSMDIAYEITLYDLGDIPEATGGWTLTTYGGSSLTQSTYHGIVNVKAPSSTSSGVYLTNNAIDVSGFKKLQYKCGRGGEGILNVVLMPVGATSVDDAVASKGITIFASNPTTMEEMDISGISGKYRVGVSLKGSSGPLNCYIAYMYLE